MLKEPALPVLVVLVPIWIKNFRFLEEIQITVHIFDLSGPACDVDFFCFPCFSNVVQLFLVCIISQYDRGKFVYGIFEVVLVFFYFPG